MNLTIPLTTLLNLADTPGEAAGFGPLDAGTSRTLAAARHPATRWCLTVTDETGRVIGHGCAHRAVSSAPRTRSLALPDRELTNRLVERRCGAA